MYIKKDDYLLFDGINLEQELPDDDNSKGKVDRFINEVELWTITQLKMLGFKESMINDYNIKEFKYGLMYQIRHFLRYGRDNKMDENAYEMFLLGGFIRVVAY